MKDEYGTVLRERMKDSMSEPAGFRPLNRRLDYYDGRMAKLQKIVAWCAAVLLVTTFWVQVFRFAIRHFHL